MPRGVITPTVSAETGVVLPAETAGDPVNFHQIANSGRTLILVRNNHGTTPYNVTIHVRATVKGKNVPEEIVSVPATQTWVFGPYDTQNYGTDIWIDPANAELKIRAIEPGISV